LYDQATRILDRFCSPDSMEVLGHVVGSQDIDEALGIWYPSHQAFMTLMSAPASEENMRLRALAVEHADLHRCQAY
jgi:hypothetical protein